MPQSIAMYYAVCDRITAYKMPTRRPVVGTQTITNLIAECQAVKNQRIVSRHRTGQAADKACQAQGCGDRFRVVEVY